MTDSQRQIVQKSVPANLSYIQMQEAFAKIDRRLTDLRAFDYGSIISRDDSRIGSLEVSLWQSVGHRLIEETKASAKARGTTQIVVVCGAHDYPKRKFLSEQNLQVASEWFVGGIV